MQKYKEVITWVLTSIGEGVYQSGEKLPTETELSRRFGVSRQTVRHAIGELVDRQVLYSVQGSGTYVSGRKSGEEGRRAAKRHNRIAVLSTYIDGYIFPSILKGIEESLSSAGYAVQISITDNQVRRERSILERILTEKNIDGLIAEPSRSALPNPNLELYTQLSEEGVPVLFFNASYPDLSFPCIRIDDRQAAADAVRLLLGRGHKSIGGIFKSDDRQGILRYRGYTEALMEAGLEIREELTGWYDTADLPDMTEMCTVFARRLQPCSGIICYNDFLAIRLIDALLSEGRCIPEDISVVSIDNSALSEMGKVPFTSMHHPKEELGTRAAELMLQMQDGPVPEEVFLFAAKPVFRNSIADIR